MKNQDLFISPRKMKSFMDTHLNKMLKDQELKSSQVHFIMMIGEDEGCSMKELSMIVGSDKGLTTRVVGTLIKNGYVENKSGSGRTYSLYLTEKGREAYDQCRTAADKLVDILIGCLDAEDVEHMRTIATKINKRLDESYRY
jgi:DNA-binding MarR family transcriptional regulator